MATGHAHSATGHTHSHRERGGRAGAGTSRRLAITLVLVLVYMAAEVAGGLAAGSLALLADAGHMLSDAGALGLALFAIWFAARPATARHTFGYYRAEILAALLNGATLVAIAIFICIEAWERIREPSPVQGGLMMGIAAGGLVVNGIGLWILHGGRNESLNVRGAWLHVLTDALGSVQAVVAGALILAFGWYWVDPVASVLIGGLVVYSSWALLRESVAVLMEGTPGHIDLDEVRGRLAQVPGVEAVSDLHVWTISSRLVALSAHLKGDRPDSGTMDALRHDLAEHFGIDHTTIQFDPPDDPERCCPVR